MKHAKLLYAMGAFVIGLMLLGSQQSILAQSSLTYAYLRLDPPSQVTLIFLDHESQKISGSRVLLENSASWINLDLFNLQLYSAQGGWIAFPFRLEQNDKLIFINLEQLDTAPRVLEMDAGVRIRSLRWSPDIHYLSLSVFTDQGVESLLLYDFPNDKLIKIDDGAGTVTWYRDSTKFAVEKTLCSQEFGCKVGIEIFNVTTRAFTASLDIQAQLDQKLQSNGRTCNLDWSPDGQYITYMYDCNYFNSDIPREMYIWDTTMGVANRLTDFTLAMWEKNEGLLAGYYAVLWRNTETFLLGIRAESFNSIVTQTVEVYVPDRSFRKIADHAVLQWVLNPQTEFLAIRSVIANTPQTLPETGSLHIATYGIGETLDLTTPSLGEGCDMAWSPDGKYLAFTQRGDLSCGLPVKAIRFYDDATKQVSEYVLPDYDPTVTTILPLGWVQISAAGQ
ncbi:MAG: PD40 domain-containing protein [Anaerolineae bacterium]|nr:PD40 domain-containing protein [Anaerolineae bacterium]